MLIQEQNRHQPQLLCLEEMIGLDNEVRFIDAFVDALDLEELQFVIKGQTNEGRPAYSTNSLLKLYIYGYLNQVSSSRKLAKQARINLEVLWLLKSLQPKFRVIADFRKDNSRALKKTFNVFNKFLRDEDLFSKTVIAVDGSYFRAQNSKSNNYSQKKVSQQLAYIEKQETAYLAILDQGDAVDTEAQQAKAKLLTIEERKAKYKKLETDLTELSKEGVYQVSTTDPDARLLSKSKASEVVYNNIIATEGENKFIVSLDTTNTVDTNALAKASRKAKVALGLDKDNTLITIADKGFDTGNQLAECHRHNIDTLVSAHNRSNTEKATQFSKIDFLYDRQKDVYICPANQELISNGKWYKDTSSRSDKYIRKKTKNKLYYRSYKSCVDCPLKDKCLSPSAQKQHKGRSLKRNEYQDAIDKNLANIEENKELYKQRKALVEHPFGTIKRQWGYTYTKLKGFEKVSGEFGLIALCYNIRRAISILGVSGLIEAIKGSILAFLLLTGLIEYHSIKLMNEYTSTHSVWCPILK